MSSGAALATYLRAKKRSNRRGMAGWSLSVWLGGRGENGVLMTAPVETSLAADNQTSARASEFEVLHWFDLTCPFCYVSQNRDEILSESGFDVVDLPFQAHPEIPVEGILVGPRRGPMYEELERQAMNAGLPLNWPARLPNSRTALAASAWVGRNNRTIVRQFNARLFSAHFALGEDLGNADVVIRHAAELGVDIQELSSALADGRALRELSSAETMARDCGVRGTPTWLVRGTLIEGAFPLNDFRRLVDKARGGKAERADAQTSVGLHD
jgi:predicted DsbA family dithiol-disulfide isomerase